jgi:predicted Rossmann fold flavoprotein
MVLLVISILFQQYKIQLTVRVKVFNDKYSPVMVFYPGMNNFDLIVIGAGPAGMMASGHAAAKGLKVIVLEKMVRPGFKLRITGKGRCNLTNICDLPEFIDHFGKNGRFLRQAFNGFFTGELLEFLKNIDVETKVERGGRVFPVSDDAHKVTEALAKWTEVKGAVFRTQAEVLECCTTAKAIAGVKIRAAGLIEEYCSPMVVIATGGASYPRTGSTGDGYRLAGAMGHSIVPIRPALVPLETEGDIAQKLQGLSLKNTMAAIWIDGKKQRELFGELVFTHFGLSGPVILSLSQTVVDALRENRRVELSLDLKPALDDLKLDDRLLRDIETMGKRKTKALLKELLPSTLVPVCAEITGIDPEAPCHQITARKRKQLRTWLKNFMFTISGHRPIGEAIITAGGVSTKEIDPRTMESQLIKGLFFAGEVIDINADTGGYNLQAAFSTGWLAGTSAAKQ